MVVATVFLVLITILLPPVGVFLVSGCGVDLLINICLTLLGYIPGHIHAFYIEYVYYKRKEQGRLGQGTAPGVYSNRIVGQGTATGEVYRDDGMRGQGYGTIN